jgi:hypothetical protein
MKLPTEKQCLDYFKEYKVPSNIFEHCLLVQKISLFLAEKSKEKNIKTDIDLVSCLALLHDLFKMVSLRSTEPTKYHNPIFSEEEKQMWAQLRKRYPQMHEGDVAYLVFKDDFPEFALALKNVSTPKKKDRTWEESIVHYADWRVFRNQVVSLQERLDYLKEVYTRSKEDWIEDQKIILQFENKMMGLLEVDPSNLSLEVENAS